MAKQAKLSSAGSGKRMGSEGNVKTSKHSIRRDVFVREYLKDFNGTRAAIAAGFSQKTAYSQGSRLLRNVEVQKALSEAQTRRLNKLDLSADRVLQEMASIAFFDVRRIFNDDGELIPISKLDPEVAAAIASLDHQKLFEHFGKGQARQVGNTVKVKIADKTKALEMLGRHYRLFAERLEVGGPNGEPLKITIKLVKP